MCKESQELKFEEKTTIFKQRLMIKINYISDLPKIRDLNIFKVLKIQFGVD